MKKFLKNFLAISLIVIGITAVIECLLLTKMNPYAYKSSYVKNHADEIECLLLGSSHFEEGLCPDSMGTGIFNMARSGRYLIYDVALAQKHVPQLHHLKTLIIPYEYFEFYQGRNEAAPSKKATREELEPTIKCMNYKYMGLRVDPFWCWSEFLYSNEDFMGRFFKSNDELIGSDSLGYVALSLSGRQANWAEKGLPDKIDPTRSKDPELARLLDEHYTALAELTQAHHVRLIFLSTPYYKTYQEMMDPGVMAEMDAYMKALQQRYPHIEYYNYSFDDRFVADDFFDSSHLTTTGAAKFSKMVKAEVLEKQPATSR